MYNVPVARKVCATCKWWRGKRDFICSAGQTSNGEMIGVHLKLILSQSGEKSV